MWSQKMRSERDSELEVKLHVFSISVHIIYSHWIAWAVLSATKSQQAHKLGVFAGPIVPMLFALKEMSTLPLFRLEQRNMQFSGLISHHVSFFLSSSGSQDWKVWNKLVHNHFQPNQADTPLLEKKDHSLQIVWHQVQERWNKSQIFFNCYSIDMLLFMLFPPKSVSISSKAKKKQKTKKNARLSSRSSLFFWNGSVQPRETMAQGPGSLNVICDCALRTILVWILWTARKLQGCASL